MQTVDLIDEGVLEIPLDNLLEYCDPTLDDPWGCGRIDSEDVKLQVGFSNDCKSPKEYDDDLYASYDYNISRIAYLLENDWSDVLLDTEPITIDVGLVGYTPNYLIVDGNHRIAAAKIRGDKFIKVSIIGDIEKAISVLQKNEMHIDDYM